MMMIIIIKIIIIIGVNCSDPRGIEIVCVTSPKRNLDGFIVMLLYMLKPGQNLTDRFTVHFHNFGDQTGVFWSPKVARGAVIYAVLYR